MHPETTQNAPECDEFQGDGNQNEIEASFAQVNISEDFSMKNIRNESKST